MFEALVPSLSNPEDNVPNASISPHCFLRQRALADDLVQVDLLASFKALYHPREAGCSPVFYYDQMTIIRLSFITSGVPDPNGSYGPHDHTTRT